MRRNFPKSVKVAVIKRATRDNVIYCEKCHLPCRKFEIDHIIPDSHGGEPTVENAELLCKGAPDKCHDTKTAQHDTPIAAKLKRIEAKHLGVRSNARPIPSRTNPPVEKKHKPLTKQLPPRRDIYSRRIVE